MAYLDIAKISVTSAKVVVVPTKELLAAETGSFVSLPGNLNNKKMSL